MRHYDFSDKRSVELTPKRLGSYDCVLIATDHSSYDYEAIVKQREAGGGHAQRHAAREEGARKSSTLLRFRGAQPHGPCLTK